MNDDGAKDIREQTEAKAKLKELKDTFEQAKKARRPFETEWYLNLAFYQGEHWLAWARGRFSKPQMEKWRVLFTDNRVQPVIRTEVAKMSKQRPDWTATPTGADDRAVTNALRSERLLDSRWDVLDCQRKLRTALLWSRIAGAGFWRIGWDKTVNPGAEILIGPDGEPVMNPQTGTAMRRENIPQELLDEAEQSGMRWEQVSEGECDIEVRSPLEIYPDPLADDEGIPSCRYIIEECVRSPEHIEDRYGVKVKPDAKPIRGITEDRMPLSGGEGDRKELGVRVWEMFERPCKKYRKGRHCVWTDKALLADEENPADEHGLPYVMFNGIPVPGRFWPTSTATAIRPLNAELNKTRSQVRENAARFGNPALLVPQDQQFTWYGVPGEQVKFDPYAQQVPSFMTPPALPGYVQNEPALIENSIREVSGQHEITQGNVPAGVTAASAINLLQEQDDTRIGPDVWDMERALSVAGQMLLRIMCEYYRTDRLVALGGEDGGWDIDTFRAEMLSEVPQVQVQTGSMFPQSKAARMAQMKDLLALFLQYGVPLSAHDLGKFLRGFEVGGLDRLVAGFSQNESQIARENMMLAQGVQLPVNDFDDDEAHLEGHAEVMKSRRFLLYPPEVQAAHLAHWQMHQAKIQQQAQQQMMLMQAAQGGGQGGDPPAAKGPAGANQPAPQPDPAPMLA